MRFVTLPAVAVSLMVALSCGSRDTQSVRIDPALLTLVPPDTIAMGGARIDQIKKTTVYSKYIAQRPFPAFDALRERLGIDAREDLWEVLAASDGKDTVLFARGRFSPQGIEPKLEKEGGRRTQYKGYTLVGNDEGAITFMNTSTAVAGPARAVQSVIDQRDSGANPPAALLDRTKQIPSGAQLWAVSSGAVSRLPPGVADEGNLANLGKVFRSLDGFSGWADLSSGFHLNASGTSATEQDAKKLHDAIRGLLGLARLNTPDGRTDLLRVYDRIDVSMEERTVKIEADLPMELVEKLAAAAGELHRR